MTDDFYKKKRPDGDEHNPMSEPRFAEIATFMRAPLVESLDNVDIGLIGVPTDLGVTNRPGARHGPREIRNSSSLMRTFNLGMNINPYKLCRIADLGDVSFSQRYDLDKQVEEIESFYQKIIEKNNIEYKFSYWDKSTHCSLTALGINNNDLTTTLMLLLG